MHATDQFTIIDPVIQRLPSDTENAGCICNVQRIDIAVGNGCILARWGQGLFLIQMPFQLLIAASQLWDADTGC